MIKEAFLDLYPEEEFLYEGKVTYTKRLKEYNANIRKSHGLIEVRMSHLWKDIGKEVRMGLVQLLLMKLFKGKKETLYTDLYHGFIKNLATFTPKTKSDPLLEKSFTRVNTDYFDGLMELPNLQWGTHSVRQIGLYNYHNDTITMSKILEDHSEILDYVMYHELLHKKEKFTHKNGRSLHHSKKFRDLEKRFKNAEVLEKELEQVIRKKRRGVVKKAWWKIW